jgi:hypothetical protein
MAAGQRNVSTKNSAAAAPIAAAVSQAPPSAERDRPRWPTDDSAIAPSGIPRSVPSAERDRLEAGQSGGSSRARALGQGRRRQRHPAEHGRLRTPGAPAAPGRAPRSQRRAGYPVLVNDHPTSSLAAGFLLAAALGSGAREDAFRAGYLAGLRAASLVLSRIASGIPGGQVEWEKTGRMSFRLLLGTNAEDSHGELVTPDRIDRGSTRPHDTAGWLAPPSSARFMPARCSLNEPSGWRPTVVLPAEIVTERC